MQRFYSRPEKEILGLSITRFWNKKKNMEILKLREKLDMISNLLLPYSSNVTREISKIEWRLNRLLGQEKTDSITDIKKKQKPVKSKELDDIRRLLMRQRRERKKKKDKR